MHTHTHTTTVNTIRYVYKYTTLKKSETKHNAECGGLVHSELFERLLKIIKTLPDRF